MGIVFRDPLSILTTTTTPAPAPVRMVAPSFTARPAVALGGLARFADGVLEISGPDGLRVPVRDIVAFDAMPATAGRTRLTLMTRRAGTTQRHTFWISGGDRDALQRLVASVRAALVARV
jgi:hypothetical protein